MRRRHEWVRVAAAAATSPRIYGYLYHHLYPLSSLYCRVEISSRVDTTYLVRVGALFCPSKESGYRETSTTIWRRSCCCSPWRSSRCCCFSFSPLSLSLFLLCLKLLIVSCFSVRSSGLFVCVSAPRLLLLLARAQRCFQRSQDPSDKDRVGCPLPHALVRVSRV